MTPNYLTPDQQLCLLVGLLLALAFAAFIARLHKHDQDDSKEKRRLAKLAFEDIVDAIYNPDRHGIVGPSCGEQGQFVYLLLGRNLPPSPTGNMIWAEISMLREIVSIKIFYTSDIEPNDAYMKEMKRLLQTKGWFISAYETNKQPELEAAGVYEWANVVQ